jgi:hypothetical protein
MTFGKAQSDGTAGFRAGGLPELACWFFLI